MRLILAACFLFAAGAARAASGPAVEAAHGMVVSSQRLASEAGIEILKAGGNAVDAAVAVGYAEAVTNPCCGNIGGGGFLVAHLAASGDRAARDVFINFREMAPAAASAGMYLDAAGNVIPEMSLYGWRAAGVPGTVMGLDTALVEYGTMPREVVMAPAIRLARDGFVLTRGDTDILDAGARKFRAHPDAARIFMRPDGTGFAPGDRLVQPDLAATLEAIAGRGADAFYRGRIPEAVEAASRAGGGLLTAEDFATYRVTESAPVSCAYRGYVVVSAPPPSSGGTTMCEIMNILEGYDMHALGFHSAQAVHLMAEAMRHAYLDRNTYLGDPAFVQNPLERLLSKSYAAAIRARIGDAALPSAALRPGVEPHEKTETTHYSVVDGSGNAVSVTYTINGLFGAVWWRPAPGSCSTMRWTISPSGRTRRICSGWCRVPANAIAPGKRPLSSMAPSLVTRDGKTFMVVGSPGGARIITITLEAILNVIDYGMAPQEAVDAPRLHHQWLPDQIAAEPFALSPDTQALLRGMGYKLVEQTPWGAVEMIAVGPPKSAAGPASSGNDSTQTAGMRPGLFYGANDDRRPAGAAIGY